MILAITRENEKLVYDVCKELGDEIVQVANGVDNLKKLVKETVNLNNYKYIIIDIDSTKESEDDIINSVSAIKAMYNIRVIILALGHEEGDRLLSRLFFEGVYNFVNGKTYSEQKEQLKFCLTGEGNQYKDSIRFRQKVEENGKNKVIIKKEYKTLKQFVNIAVAGTEKHIGVTTQAILITMFLKSLNMNVCYICANEKNEIKNICNIDGAEIKDGMYVYKGIDLYGNNNKIDAMKYGYDFYIYDYGTLDDNTMDNFLSKDIKVIVAGTKAWEYDNTFRILKMLEQVKDINYIFNFSSDEEKRQFRNDLKKYVKNLYFSNITTDTWKEDVNSDIYHEVFKDYIAEKSNKLEVIEKKSIFNIFKKRK